MPCVCGRKANGTFWVQCDGCDVWFHGKCVGVTAQTSVKLLYWFCTQCKPRQIRNTTVSAANKDVLSAKSTVQVNDSSCWKSYLCLCKSPSNQRFTIVGCCECRGWFHPICINMKESVQGSGMWLCPKCKPYSDHQTLKSKLVDAASQTASNSLVETSSQTSDLLNIFNSSTQTDGDVSHNNAMKNSQGFPKKEKRALRLSLSLAKTGPAA